MGEYLTETARIDTDLLCWQCGYNLRTLSEGATCPECGFAVGESVVRSKGWRARRFSLHTLPPASRVFGWAVGLVVPVGVVLLAASDPMNPIETDWQSGRVEDYVGVMLAGRAMWAFYPLLFWAYVAFAALLIKPGVMGRYWWVRAGLILGVLLGVQYQLIIAINLGGIESSIAYGLLGAMILMGVVGLAVGLTLAERSESYDPPPLRPRSVLSRTITITVVSLLCGAWMSVGLIFALLLAPFGMAFCMLAALCRLYRTDFDVPMQRTRAVPATAAAAGYLAAWPIAITQAQIVYQSLPTSPPGCYIVTASARGHCRLTRPLYYSVDAHGRPLPVTRQMLVLKEAELAIAAKWPGLHRALRRVYDYVGPPIAQRITNPWLADVSYLLFTVPAWVARRLLRRP